MTPVGWALFRIGRKSLLFTHGPYVGKHNLLVFLVLWTILKRDAFIFKWTENVFPIGSHE